MSSQPTNSDDASQNNTNGTIAASHRVSSGMTPSIMTTINNTTPHGPVVSNSASYSNMNTTSIVTKGNRRTNEPYESYIEDSFVGHWEREDDDPLYEYGQHGAGGDMTNGTSGDDESTLHPSTIEFDFDSFGPESIIYTPNNKSTDVKVESEQKDDRSEGHPTDESLILGVDKFHIEDKDEVVQMGNAIIQSQMSEKQAATSSNLDHQKSDNLKCAVGQAPETHEHNDMVPIDHIVDSNQIDLKVIEPYKKVISHAGYCHHTDPSAPAHKPGESAPAIIVFSACYLPDRSRRDYNYVMDHLFLYVLSSLHELIADDYILIYLHNTQPNPPSSIVSPNSNTNNNGSASSSSGLVDENARATTPQNNLPTFGWMKRCYQMIDRKLRKNLKILYLVKPTFWLKTIVIMCKPFISSKFSKKLRFIEDMNGLRACLPLDQLILPASADSI